MKRITKIITILLALLLIPRFAPPVQAQGKNKWPNPNFMNAATLTEKTSMPYYDLDATIDVYISSGLSYYVDEDTHAVVQILPEEMNFQVDPTYNEQQLKEMAETIAYDFVSEEINLKNLSYMPGQKIGTYFFHWEDSSKQLDDGTHPFIQVGLSQNGDFLNLVNTLPFGKDAGTFDVSQKINSAAATTFFNEIYANGGSYWSQYGTLIPATGGWYSFPTHPGCSGTFCSKYYYSTATANPLYYGQWTPTINTNTRAAAFIPNYNATAVVRYAILPRYSSMVTVDINQNAYFNSMAPLKSSAVSAIRNGIANIRLWDAGFNGTGNSNYKVAWDEVRIFTQSFDDVPETYWAFYDIERLFLNGVTSGCTATTYCPESTVTRAQMAIFLLRGIYGSSYVPPAVNGTRFADVPDSYWAADWIEQLAAENITAGCGNGNYCPEYNVTHAQMAIFLLRSKHGSSYIPPSVYGTRFADVPDSHWAADWIEQQAAEGISSGSHATYCGNGTGNYCPEYPVTRAEMAGMLVRAFNLQ